MTRLGSAREFPIVSVITPVFNARSTIERTLASVLAQRFIAWEHLIVIDGGTDDSENVARHAAGRDPRIHVMVQANAGPAAARNRGIAAARGEWLLFLDSDDTIASDHLLRMLAHVRCGHIDAVCCGYRRLDKQGRELARYPAPDLDGPALAIALIRPPSAIHAFIARRALVQEVGNFDTELSTNEDWDLWMKLARRGARFAREKRILADYRASGSSLTRDPVKMLRDAAIMRQRAGNASAEHALRAVLWSGAQDIAGGGDGSATLRFVEPLISPINCLPDLSAALLEGVMLGCGEPVERLIDLWQDLAGRTGHFLQSVSDRAGMPTLAPTLARNLEWDIIRTGHLGGSRIVGDTLAVELSLRVLYRGIDASAGQSRIVFKSPLLRPRGKFMFSMDGHQPVSGRKLRKYVCDRLLRSVTSFTLRCRNMSGIRPSSPTRRPTS